MIRSPQYTVWIINVVRQYISSAIGIDSDDYLDLFEDLKVRPQIGRHLGVSVVAIQSFIDGVDRNSYDPISEEMAILSREFVRLRERSGKEGAMAFIIGVMLGMALKRQS